MDIKIINLFMVSNSINYEIVYYNDSIVIIFYGFINLEVVWGTSIEIVLG
jgi:hypothetical protein